MYLSDKATAIYPPYSTEEQKANVKQYFDWNEKDFWIWNKEDSKKYFVAGGGQDSDFERLWKTATKDVGTFKTAIAKQTYHSAGASLMYLVSGRKKFEAKIKSHLL